AQVIVLLVVAGFELTHAHPTFASSPNVDDTGRATGGLALLFVCASLPLYFGSELRGGSRAMRGVLAGSVALVGAAFLVAAVSLVDPDRFYDDLLKPSLGALFVSQLAVFLVFPRFRRGPAAVAAAAIASGLAAWGLYTLIAGSAAT